MVEAGKNLNEHDTGVYIEYMFVRLGCLSCLSQHHRASIHLTSAAFLQGTPAT
jgi:hypothetical protein